MDSPIDHSLLTTFLTVYMVHGPSSENSVNFYENEIER
jgi:hypothetical protein